MIMVRQDIIDLERQIAELGEQIERIRNYCPHTNTTETSNWEDTSNGMVTKTRIYKIKCNDCGKIIREWHW